MPFSVAEVYKNSFLVCPLQNWSWTKVEWMPKLLCFRKNTCKYSWNPNQRLYSFNYADKKWSKPMIISHKVLCIIYYPVQKPVWTTQKAQELVQVMSVRSRLLPWPSWNESWVTYWWRKWLFSFIEPGAIALITLYTYWENTYRTLRPASTS